MKHLSIVIAMMFFILLAHATLIHRYQFNNNLTDDFAGPALIPVNVASSYFDNGTWNWTANSTPGGGLLVNTTLPTPNSYGIRIVFKYLEINTVWTKIISFHGYNNVNNYFSSDQGLYFNHGNLYLYPYLNNTSIIFQPNTWYDLFCSRSASGLVQVYLNPVGQPGQLMIEYNDFAGDYTASQHNGNSCWGLFYDDTTTTAEWTIGGSVATIEIYSDQNLITSVQNPVLTKAGEELYLSWDSFAGASSYNVYASDDLENGPWDLLSNTQNTSLQFTSGSPYRFYQIRAVLD